MFSYEFHPFPAVRAAWSKCIKPDVPGLKPEHSNIRTATLWYHADQIPFLIPDPPPFREKFCFTRATRPGYRHSQPITGCSYYYRAINLQIMTHNECLAEQWCNNGTTPFPMCNCSCQTMQQKKTLAPPWPPHEDKCVGEVSYQCFFSIRDTPIDAKPISVSSAAVIKCLKFSTWPSCSFTLCFLILPESFWIIFLCLMAFWLHVQFFCSLH